MAATSRTTTPARSPTPEMTVQPDHFYGHEDIQFLPSPNSEGRTWLDPSDDPAALRGIPVFKPTLQEFEDFEAYMMRVEPWGMRSGIVKIIPPKEWSDRLPSVVPQLDKVRLKHPIEQHMVGQGGLFQQQNIEKRRVMSVREWYELCSKDDLRAPGVEEVGIHARANNGPAKTRTRRSKRANPSAGEVRMSETAEPEAAVVVKDEHDDDPTSTLLSPPLSHRNLSPAENVEESAQQQQSGTPGPSNATEHQLAEEEGEEEDVHHAVVDEDAKAKKGRKADQRRESKEAQLAERAEKDREWLESFTPSTAWLPPKTDPSSYTTDFCKELERRYWRNCGFGKPPWYGADMQGSLFTEETTSWNVASLPSALTRLLPEDKKGLPGVNTPYLYFGMWRATFAWHVEDMDLFSINYIHFGAPKFWYAMPQARANALEQTMKGLYPGAGKKCSQFLRHKSYLASPTVLAKTSCRPNCLVQHAGEFVITFPRGYHAGFNLGFNCAESVNFALESWIDLGRKAEACGCVNFSVRIDVDQLLYDRAAENREVFLHTADPRAVKSEPADDPFQEPAKTKSSRKRKSEGDPSSAKPKKLKIKPSSSASASALDQPVASSSSSAQPSRLKIMLKLPPRPPKPKEPETLPCCLCVSMSRDDLLPVHDPPTWWYDPSNAELAKGPCMAHAECANVIPETWVDEVEDGEPDEQGVRRKRKVVFGVDGIVKDRWNLKCSACAKTKHKAHGAPIQCTKGKCPKAFHVSCARDGAANGIVFNVLREVEKEVVLLDGHVPPPPTSPQSGPPVLLLHPAPDQAQTPAETPTKPLPMPEHMEVDAQVSGFIVPQAGQPRALTLEPRVLKTIKKIEVELLCNQHNPAILAAKKAQQQDKIRNALAALPPMSRIKLRVTAGVFEVTLVRIIEETCSVEVLWDKGLKREFKWRGVVFGETDGVVGHKPTEAAPEPERMPVSVRPSYPPPPSTAYRPSPLAPSPAPGPSTVTLPPTHTSPSPGVTTPTYLPSSSHYRPTTFYQPQGTSAYSYPSGNWSYHYGPAPASQPQQAPSTSTGYGQTAYTPNRSQTQTPSGSYYPYSNPAGTSTYSQYQPYGGYSGYVPARPPSQAASAPSQSTPAPVPLAPAPAPSQPQRQTSPQSQPQTQQPQTQRGSLQWQQPYTGPREPATTITTASSVSPAPPVYGFPHGATPPAGAQPSQTQPQPQAQIQASGSAPSAP